MWCRAAVFAVEGSAGRVPAQRAVRARTPCADARRRPASPWAGSRRTGPGCSTELRRVLPDLDRRPPTWTPTRCSTVQSRWRAQSEPLDVDPLLGTLPLAYTDAAGAGRQTAPQLRPDAVDHDAEAPSAAVLRSGRRRRWRAQPQSAAAEPAAGQRPRHHSRTPARDSLSRMELVDQEFHARPRCGARTCTRQHAPASRCRSSAELRKWFEEHTHRAMTRSPRGRLRPRRRAVRPPLHRPDHRRGDRAAHLPRAAAQQP